MKKVTLILLLTLMTHFGFSQVGINTTTPNAQLDIRSSNQMTPANNDGILIPKIDAFPLTNPTAAQQGMMVYLTTLSAGKTPGFYYWDNGTASWLGLGGDKGWDLPGNTISDTLKFVGTTNSVDLIFKSYNHRGGRIGNTNTSIGRNALNPMVTGNDNSAFGKNALNMAGSGMGNSGFGSGSLKAISSGNQNTAMGYNSLMANSTGGENTALGFNAMIVNSSGFANTAVGSQSLYSTNGSNNVGIGYFAGSSITSGSGNIAIGLNAQVPTATGNSQLSIGNVVYGADMDSTLLGKIGIGVTVPTEKLEVAGKTKTTNLQVTNGAIAGNVLTSDALGNATWQSPSVTSAWNLTGNSGYNPATSFIGSIDSKEVFFRHTNQPSGVIGVSDTGFGYRSGGLYSLIAKNTAVGSLAAESNTVSTENSAFGSEALNKNTAGSKNVAIGNKALFNQAFSNGGVEFDTNNTVVGYAAMYNTNSTSPSIGTYNTALGNYALSNNASGSSNVAVGASALGVIWTGLGTMSGNRNVAIGAAAIKNLTTGNDNLAIGHLSLNYNTTGSSNVSIGTDALFYSSEQSNGTAIGTRAMQNYAIFQPAGTNDNVAVGYESLRGTSTVGLHFKNTAIGYQSMTSNVTGSFNTSLGHKTLFTNTSGATNTALGNSALYLNSMGSGNIAIGNESGYNETGSNKLYIENSNSTTPLIYGEFDTDLLKINGNLKINNVATIGNEMQIVNKDNFTHFFGNQIFGNGGDHFIISSEEVGFETGGMYADGNAVTIWSAGDANQGQAAALVYFLDEDFYDGANTNPYDNNALRSYISPVGAYVQISDKNKKDNIVKIENATEKINQISGYTYQFKLAPEEIKKGDKPIKSSGVLAQELEKVLPEAVQKNESGEYFVDYAAITPLLIEALKEQNTKIKSLEERLKAIEEKLSK